MTLSQSHSDHADDGGPLDASAGLSRRRFLSGLGMLGVAVAGGQLAASFSSPAAAAGDEGDGHPPSTADSSSVLTTTGLHAGPWDYLNNRSSVLSLGGTALRTTSTGMTDAGWSAMQADGQDVHVTISGTDRSKFSSDDAWIASYLAQVDAFLTRYPARWIEVWNEPNFGMWAGAKPAAKQLAYGKLLVATYAHIENRWPGVGVVGFGAGAASAAAPGFIRGVFAAVPAAATAFDVCSLHPYFGTTAPEMRRTEAWGSWTIDGTVSSLRSAGITKPIWFTEAGWAISQAAGGKFSEPAANTVSPQLQAAYRVRLFVQAMKLGVSRLNHMYVIDTDGYNGGFFSNKVARPQAVAFATQQAVLKSPTSITTISEGPDVWAYQAWTANGPVTVAWAAGAEQTNLPSTPGGRFVRADGALSRGITRGNEQQVRLNQEPRYLVPADTACDVARIGMS